MDGFFLVDKPKGMTSFSVVNQIKKKFHYVKCGHSGTLDPNTTGLLIVAVNRATKLLKLIHSEDKVYLATISFGYDSNTLDFDGTITQNIRMLFNEEELDFALETLKKKESQIPPMVSAIKINGRKLYEYERKQIEVEVKEREVHIYSLEKKSDLRFADGHLEIDLEIHCSKGFYVRSFARDLGALLGGCAILKDLRRVANGKRRVEEATPLNLIEEKNMISIPHFFSKYPILEVNAFLARLALNGVVFDERQIITDLPFYIVYNGQMIALYEPIAKNKYKPVVIFKEMEQML